MKKAFLEMSPKIEFRLSSVHLGILSVLMLLYAFDVIRMEPLVFKALISWVAINLLALPIARKRFITPTIANPKCPYCGGNLISTELYCEKCKSTSKAYKEK